MEAAGLISRQRRADDERSVDIQLTDQGAALRDRATAVPRKVAAATGLNPDDLKALRDQLTALAETIRAQHLTPDEQHRGEQ